MVMRHGSPDAPAERRAAGLQRREVRRPGHRLAAGPDVRGLRADHLGQRLDRRHGRHLPQYAQQDSRIRYLRQPRNIGLAPNHNYVFAQARGELFKWAAADDLYGRDLFKLCIEALDAHPEVVLAHAWEAAIDADSHVYQSLEYPLATGSPSAPERFRSILFGSSGLFESTDPGVPGLVRVDNRGILRSCDQYGVIRSDVLRRVAPLDSYHHSDRILTVELALHGPFHITPQWLYFRRDYPDRTYNQSPKVAGPLRDPRPGPGQRAAQPDGPAGGRVLPRLLRGDPAGAAVGGGPAGVPPRARALDRWTGRPARCSRTTSPGPR